MLHSCTGSVILYSYVFLWVGSIVKMMDKSFEKSIIEYGAATLAGIKTASLFNFRFASEASCRHNLSEAGRVLNEKGVYLKLLAQKAGFYLILIYRRNMVDQLQEDPAVSGFLEEYGYPANAGTEEILSHLGIRFRQTDRFPHEIGVFLGYPVEDIRGFIDNHGKNCLICGLWKVYSDPHRAAAYFEKIDHCNTVYREVYRKGRSLADMTVAA